MYSLYVKTYLAIDPILILTLQEKVLFIFPKISNCSFKSFIKQISTFHLVKCEDLLLFSVLYLLNWIPSGFGLLFLPNNRSENVTLGSRKLWLAVLTIFWHFQDQTINQTRTVCPCSPEKGFSSLGKKNVSKSAYHFANTDHCAQPLQMSQHLKKTNTHLCLCVSSRTRTWTTHRKVLYGIFMLVNHKECCSGTITFTRLQQILLQIECCDWMFRYRNL